MSSSRVYDGSTAATVAADVSSGVLSGDTVTASATGVFDNKNVGTGKTVTVSGALAGADSGNYSL